MRAGELSRDHFRKDNGEAIREVCREFVVLCRRLVSQATLARFLAAEPQPFKALLGGCGRMTGCPSTPARTAKVRFVAAGVSATSLPTPIRDG